MPFLTPNDVDSVGDDDIASVLGLSTNASQQSKLELQMKLANALRLKEGEKGQSVPSGSVFIPPNPFNTAADTFDHLQGIVNGMQGKDQGAALDADREAKLNKFAKLWFKRTNQQHSTDPLNPNSDPNDPNSLVGPPESQTPNPTQSEADQS